jgi:2-dehydropantoate 2-reductase
LGVQCRALAIGLSLPARTHPLADRANLHVCLKPAAVVANSDPIAVRLKICGLNRVSPGSWAALGFDGRLEMRIGVMATGAVGGYFGARLAATGHSVGFIARGRNLEAIRTQGLRIESVLGDLHLPAPMVASDPAEIGPVDVLLFTVKLWDIESAARQALPMVDENTLVIPLQNGVDSAERLAPILGAEAVTPGCAYIAATLSAPGIVRHTSKFARMIVGRSDGDSDPRLTAFADAAKAAGIDVSVSPAIEKERWQKFVFLVGLSGATASTRLPLGPILADPDTQAFFHSLMREVVAVGRAKGVALAPDFADDRLEFGKSSPPTFKASMLHDLENGNRLELDWLAGRVVQLGRQLGVSTPWNEAVYAILKLHRDGAPKIATGGEP